MAMDELFEEKGEAMPQAPLDDNDQGLAIVDVLLADAFLRSNATDTSGSRRSAPDEKDEPIK